MTKIAIVCRDCGSPDVSAENVTGYWSVTKQDWGYEHYDGGVYCRCCGDNGADLEIEYDPERYNRQETDFEVGDLVKFHEGIPDYSELVGNDKLPGDVEHVLALVVEPPNKWGKPQYGGNNRDTVPVRLFTGELIEVWPRDIYKVEDKS